MNIRASSVILTISSIFENLFVVIEIVSRLINRIFVYSAIKINANGELLYSILNPDTNSDSPSLKSNGVRCVSARIEIIHEIMSGISRKETHRYSF